MSTEIEGDLINAIKMIDHAVMRMNYITLLDQISDILNLDLCLE